MKSKESRYRKWIENELDRQKLEEIEILKFRVGLADCSAEIKRIEKKYAKRREGIFGGE